MGLRCPHAGHFALEGERVVELTHQVAPGWGLGGLESGAGELGDTCKTRSRDSKLSS